MSFINLPEISNIVAYIGQVGEDLKDYIGLIIGIWLAWEVIMHIIVYLDIRRYERKFK